MKSPDPIAMAERDAREGFCPTREEWDAEPETIRGYCGKGCYRERDMDKGSVYEFGTYGIRVCAGCGYAFPPNCV